MPCNSDYLEPSEREKELQRAAKLLVYVNRALKIKSTRSLIQQAEDCYGQDDEGVSADAAIPELCQLVKEMTPAQRNAIIYNARNKEARALADWYEEHQEVDRKREREEAAKKRDAVIREKAIAKLSKEERRALGV